MVDLLVKPVQVMTSQVKPAQVTSSQAASSQVNTVATPKVDFATDLFRMLTVEEPRGNDSDSSKLDDNSWAGFQCEHPLTLPAFFVSRYFETFFWVFCML